MPCVGLFEQVNYIVQNATDRSLILLDEVGRGTSPVEGAAMCYALCEHFILTCDAFVFLTTHFQELTRSSCIVILRRVLHLKHCAN